MSLLERYWIRPIPAVRPWLFFKATLLLFGLDAFYEHLRPAWRYGAAGFNVAHFAILDALPIPTSAFYVGAMIATGLVAFACALAPRPHRALIAFVAIAYLWSWSCSMHDSYQHHYLLSLFFLAFAFLPLLSARDLFGTPDAVRARAPAPAQPPAAKKKDRARAPVVPDPTRVIARAEADIAVGVALVALGVIATAARVLLSDDAGRIAWLALVISPSLAGATWIARAALAMSRALAPSSPRGAISAALPHGVVPRASAWAMVVVWTTASIVYAYTAVSKTEDEWFRGDALRNITANGRAIPGAVDLFASFGIEGDDLWPFLGASTVALQIGLAIGYALAPIRDHVTHRGGRIALEVVSYVALALALSFHLGAEYMGLEIGWFSWYMILLALATFLPARALGYAALFLSWPLRSLSSALDARADTGIAGAVLATLAGCALLAAGTYADLPGATVTCVTIGVGVMAAAIAAMMRKQALREVRGVAVALLLGAAGLVAMLPKDPDVRYDYWRFAGGDFRRRGEWALALEAYQHANRYAPEGESRDAQIEQMRARIRAEGPRRDPR